ncbi:extracellular solute-binding protein [Desulfosporosinus meridiei]|uniref:ABC-type molybdate transport system, periplasmic component n=1 Tax=Desulfosporosinus meridiei (strain ATCC BAA-275 / DSM 13257 / KCTC 12902 / NCIMB 13706 / S10) TaxID=768704 RepID=J7IZT3_DESMD|nr:extracellular solute-binding protein [Desulfosporosinus meridiei]AFQ44221.1 ABC-type molybdate transport system, periplasmic component [Desulfosporosinus meridiei DSM 13257]
MSHQQILKILHAGALRKPVVECAKLLQEARPELNVELESYGSRACARQVREGKVVDILALADPMLFAELLGPEYIDKYYIFANDQIVLAYNEFSRGSGEINALNWFDILLREEVTFGRSNQHLDPCGYRTLMVWQLSEQYYGRPGLFNQLDQMCRGNLIYPKSYDLASDVLVGKLDYGFEYLCVVNQFGLRYLTLPEKINLSNPAYVDYYSQSTVSLQGKNSGEMITIPGAPIEFAIAIPKNAENPEPAKDFLDLILSKQGQQILEECGLIPY